MVTGLKEPIESALAGSVETLAEVGTARARQLRRLGIATLGDLVNYFPRSYQFESEEKPIARLLNGGIGTAARHRHRHQQFPPPRQIPIRSNPLRWPLPPGPDFFPHSGYLKKSLHPGLVVRVRGKVNTFRGLPQMVNPKWEILQPETESDIDSRLRAIYPAGGQISSEVIERIISANLPSAVAEIREWFEPSILSRRKLLGRADTYRQIHQPASRTTALAARRRLVYDELMAMQLALALSRKQAVARIAHRSCASTKRSISAFKNDSPLN